MAQLRAASPPLTELDFRGARTARRPLSQPRGQSRTLMTLARDGDSCSLALSLLDHHVLSLPAAALAVVAVALVGTVSPPSRHRYLQPTHDDHSNTSLISSTHPRISRETTIK